MPSDELAELKTLVRGLQTDSLVDHAGLLALRQQTYHAIFACPFPTDGRLDLRDLEREWLALRQKLLREILLVLEKTDPAGAAALMEALSRQSLNFPVSFDDE